MRRTKSRAAKRSRSRQPSKKQPVAGPTKGLTLTNRVRRLSTGAKAALGAAAVSGTGVGLWQATKDGRWKNIARFFKDGAKPPPPDVKKEAESKVERATNAHLGANHPAGTVLKNIAKNAPGPVQAGKAATVVTEQIPGLSESGKAGVVEGVVQANELLRHPWTEGAYKQWIKREEPGWLWDKVYYQFPGTAVRVPGANLEKYNRARARAVKEGRPMRLPKSVNQRVQDYWDLSK